MGASDRGAAAVAAVAGGGLSSAGQLQEHSPAVAEPGFDSRHFDKLAGAFSEAGIDKALYASAGGVRFRQHRNPLIRELQAPAPPPDWAAAFPQHPAAPLVLDIGAGYGRFLLTLAHRWQGYNHLGLEIRDPVVARANTWAQKLGLQGRVHFAMANATVSLDSMLGSYPGPVEWVLVQYPDPHFKKKHRKRRVVQPAMVHALARLLSPGAKVLLQSDVLECAEDMRDKFEAAGGAAFRLAPPHGVDGATFLASSSSSSSASQDHAATSSDSSDDAAKDKGPSATAGGGSGEPQFVSAWAAGGWLLENPVGVPTEREVYTLEQGRPVYRVLLARTEAV